MMSPAQTPHAIVVGTGAMGPEIAVALANAGIVTTIAGRNPQQTTRAAERANSIVQGVGVMAGSINHETFAEADLVIETIVEEVDEKRRLFQQIEPWCRAQAVLATNTSSLRIEDLANGLALPARFGGLHFLKPAHLTGVVEVIPGPATSEAALARLRGIAAMMGKTALVVQRDVPGFIWNRVQFAVLRECLHMLEEGVADAADIDAAVSDGLAPRWMAAGPLATADLGGLSTFARICESLFPHLANGSDAPNAITERAAAGTALQEWTRTDPAALDRLREAALAAGVEIATTRRRLAS
jgi:3-hydroxybutyryl-CoA dehydrogenase